MDLGLSGACVAVTGASKGIGRAICECYAADGARVALLARGAEDLDTAAERLREMGAPDVLAVPVDVTDREAVEAAFAAIRTRWGSLNALVNTVGPGGGRFEDLTDDQWHAAFQTGTMSAVLCIRAALPLLRAADWARIVNVAAHSIQRQSPLIVAYTAAKAALASVSKNLARSLAPDGILVNTVSPGTIVTATFTDNLAPVLRAEGLDASDPRDVMRWIANNFHQPADLGRAGLPDEVAVVATFLGSRRNGYTTGANVNVDGGSDFI